MTVCRAPRRLSYTLTSRFLLVPAHSKRFKALNGMLDTARSCAGILTLAFAVRVVPWTRGLGAKTPPFGRRTRCCAPLAGGLTKHYLFWTWLPFCRSALPKHAPFLDVEQAPSRARSVVSRVDADIAVLRATPLYD